VSFTLVEAIGAVADALGRCLRAASRGVDGSLVRDAVSAVAADDDDEGAAEEALEQVAVLLEYAAPLDASFLSELRTSAVAPLRALACRRLPASPELVGILRHDEDDRVRLAACRSLAAALVRAPRSTEEVVVVVDALASVLLNSSEDEGDDVVRAALGGLASVCPTLSPALRAAVLSRFHLLHEDPAEARRVYRLVVAANNNGDGASCPPPPRPRWAQWILEGRPPPSRAAGILLRRHFASEEVARCAALSLSKTI